MKDNRHPIHLLETVDSTNLELRRMVSDGAPHGTVVAAREQTAGRGRFDRKWLSRPGLGAWFSLLIRPEERIPAEKAPGLVFLAALAMANTLNTETNGGITIKWPNDLIAGGKKVAGILCEMNASESMLSWAILGIGVNLLGTDFPPDLPWAASVESQFSLQLKPNDVIIHFLKAFDELYPIWLLSGIQPILDAIVPISATLGREVSASFSSGESLTGTAKRFTEDGSLVVERKGQEHILRAGDVSVRGVMGYTDIDRRTP